MVAKFPISRFLCLLMSMSIVKIVVDIVSLLTRFSLLSIAAVFVIEFVQPVAKTF